MLATQLAAGADAAPPTLVGQGAREETRSGAPPGIPTLRPDSSSAAPKASATTTGGGPASPDARGPAERPRKLPFQTAIEEADAKLRSAEAARDRAAQTSAAFSKANAIETWARFDPAQASRYGEAIEAYRSAADVGDPEQRALARNNAGVLLLRVGSPERALEEFARLETSSAPPAQRAAYAFNHGRALEEAGRPAEALSRYEAALKENPSLTPAAEAAFRVLSHQGPAGKRSMAEAAARLVTRGQAATVVDQLRGILREGKSDAANVALLVPLVTAYAALPVPAERFQKVELPFLEELRAAGGPWREPISQIAAAYQGDVPMLWDPRDVRSLYSWWSDGSKGRALSAFLKHVGDLRAEAGDLRQAVARYQHAWAMDEENLDAVVYLAAMLRDHRQELDGDRALTRRLVGRLFGMKGEAYARGDLKSILRLHSVLGTIFEEEKGCDSSHAPDSALFQWTHAAQTAERIRAAEPAFGPTPGIHMHLSACLLAAHQNKQAVGNLIRAAEGFAQLGESDSARRALGMARGHALSAEDVARIVAVEAKVDKDM